MWPQMIEGVYHRNGVPKFLLASFSDVVTFEERGRVGPMSSRPDLPLHQHFFCTRGNVGVGVDRSVQSLTRFDSSSYFSECQARDANGVRFVGRSLSLGEHNAHHADPPPPPPRAGVDYSDHRQGNFGPPGTRVGPLRQMELMGRVIGAQGGQARQEAFFRHWNQGPGAVDALAAGLDLPRFPAREGDTILRAAALDPPHLNPPHRTPNDPRRTDPVVPGEVAEGNMIEIELGAPAQGSLARGVFLTSFLGTIADEVFPGMPVLVALGELLVPAIMIATQDD
jgi:hypothetical protein